MIKIYATNNKKKENNAKKKAKSIFSTMKVDNLNELNKLILRKDYGSIEITFNSASENSD